MKKFKVAEVALDQIWIERDKRQRKSLTNIGILADSINKLGLFHPIIVEKNYDREGYLLVAGERRLEAVKRLGWKKIPCRFYEDLTAGECKAIELEENVKRESLPWQERVTATLELHLLLSRSEKDWSTEKTAEYISMSDRHLSNILRVAREMKKGTQAITTSSSLLAAINAVGRMSKRKQEETISQLTSDVLGHTSKATGLKQSTEVSDEPEKIPDVASIEVQDYLSWLPEYDGPKFNFLHCDFPYGIGHDKSDQGGSKQFGAYEDTEELYWQLIDETIKHLDNILYPSAHIMFWFSMKYYEETKARWSKVKDIFIIPEPLIWFKSDNKGILSDPSRRPRHVYEACLFMSRGDRKIIQAIADCYAAPTPRARHVSEKSEPMLRHFFRMIVDELTEMLDPTCGSGSALRAAAGMKAKRVLGLELNPDYAQVASAQLTQSINLDWLSDRAKEREDG